MLTSFAAPSIFATPLPDSEITALNDYANWVGGNSCGSTGASAVSAGAPSATSNIFLLGDSIMVGSYYTAPNPLKKDLIANGWTPFADASGGRGMSYGGNDTANNRPAARTSALDAVDDAADTAAIAKAGRIVIEIGTNGFSASAGHPNGFAFTKAQANQLIDKILAKNTALQASDIYWVNIFSIGKGSTKITWRDDTNAMLQQIAADRGIHIIDTVGKGIDLVPADLIHPIAGPTGSEKFSTIVADGVGSPSAAGGATATPTQPALTVPATATVKDKIAQLLFVGVSSNDTATSLAKKYGIGGFLLNSGSTYSKAAIDTVKTASTIPALIAVDEEGGQVDRLGLSAPSAKVMGGLSDTQVSQKAADIGKKMAALSIDVDFAPVADLDNGANKAISVPDRSFSSDPAVVAAKAGAFADGLKLSGIVPTFKHFPGLGRATGSTGGNTDTGPATTPDLASLKAQDLKPYETLLGSANQTMVMMGNQKVPGLTAGDPASLSKPAYDLLRNDYGFSGVVITDEIGHAKAIPASLGAADAVIAALKAGADMPLFNADSEAQVGSIIDAAAAAVDSGTLTKAAIDASVSKVVALKGKGQIQAVAAATTCQCPGSASASGTGDPTLTGSTNIERAYNFFHVTHGLTPFQAAVIVGVLEGEVTGLVPDTFNGQGSGAYGIAQWLGPRLNGPKSLSDFAQQNNKPRSNFSLQLAYVWEELSGGSGAAGNYTATLNKLKTETVVDTAVYNFEDSYEGSGHGNMDARYAGAHALIDHPPGSAGGATPTAPDPASCANPTGVAGIGGYKNPYRDLTGKVPLRIDMGLDYQGKGPIYAIGNGVVNEIHKIGDGTSGWPGPPGKSGGWVSYTLSDGPAAGKIVYMSENCQPTVAHGDHVTADTVICDLDGLTSSWSEMGWAAATSGTATKAGVDPAVDWKNHDSTAFYTAYGENFSQLIEKLGDKPGTKQAGAQKLGTLPSGWPTW